MKIKGPTTMYCSILNVIYMYIFYMYGTVHDWLVNCPSYLSESSIILSQVMKCIVNYIYPRFINVAWKKIKMIIA